MRASVLIGCVAAGLLLAGGGAAFLFLRPPAGPQRVAVPAQGGPGQSGPAQGGPAQGGATGGEAAGGGAGGAGSGFPADCLFPGPAPVPPDGGAASQADMKLAHDVIQAYVQRLEAYQACRNQQADHAPAGTSEQQKRSWIEQGNAAVDAAHAIADAFSVQLKRYHAHHP